MNVGVTATRAGITQAQGYALGELLARLEPEYVHHGDCVGGDEQVDAFCAVVGIKRWAHPGFPSSGAEAGKYDHSQRAFCGTDKCDEPLPFHARNLVVASQDVLVALPKETEEPTGRARGGTWSTVTQARNRGTKTYIIWPNGVTGLEEAT